jgi:hypothetical protein
MMDARAGPGIHNRRAPQAHAPGLSTEINLSWSAPIAVQQTALHIPVIFGLDVIHGYKTIFPVSLGEASSWDPASVEIDASISSCEATADGIKWTFNPMVGISRDPRWGRVVEGSGEDPFLGSATAAAKVRGYQGTDFSVPDKMAATRMMPRFVRWAVGSVPPAACTGWHGWPRFEAWPSFLRSGNLQPRS